MEVTLLSCGTIIKTKIGKIEGMITCQSLRFGQVQYEISYFINNEQKKIWMTEHEFDMISGNHQIIGFARSHN